MTSFNTTLITGASEGIGRCLAEEFARNGHDLVLVARNKSKLASFAKELEAKHAIDVLVQPCDLIPVEAAAELFKRLEEQGVQIDILVNNAGMMQVENLNESEPDKLNSLIQLNIQSLVNMTQQFVRPMLFRGSGKIMNIGSVASFMPTPGFSTYGASKAFVLSFSEGVAQELDGTGVTVTCVCPGFTSTAMLDEVGGLEKLLPGFLKASPDDLARQAYKACISGDVVFVDKFANKLLVQWATHYPRWVVRKVNGFLRHLV